MLPTSGNLIMRIDLWRIRKLPKSAALFHNPNQDVRMADHGDDYVCLSDDDGLEHIDSLLESKYTAKDMGTLGFENSDVKSFQLLDRVFRVGVDQTGQYSDVELGLRHVHSLSGIGMQCEHQSGERTTRETSGQPDV